MSSGLCDCEQLPNGPFDSMDGDLPYHGILPYSGGRRLSATWIQPPRPADPAPPCPLAPPLESPVSLRRLRPRWPVNNTPPELRFAPDVDTITCACD